MDFGHTGSAIGIVFENTYEYRGHKYDKFDDFSQDILNFNLKTRRDLVEYTKKDVEATLKLAVDLAKEFVDTNHPVNPYSEYQTTHNLSGSITYDTQTSDGGNGGRIYAPARDKKTGHKYAGHIEYGFTDKLGIPHGPWPFLRPAMRLALAATRADFAETMAKSMFYDDWQYGSMSHGSRNARANINSVFGNRRNAVSHVRNEYQKYNHSDGRWGFAQNGIGFKSGVTNDWSMSAGSYEWETGGL